MDRTLLMNDEAGWVTVPATMPGKDMIGLGALSLVLTAYNLFKPFHIDDAAHLEIAQWIVAHPWTPMRGSLNWEGSVEGIPATNQPHLYFYLLAGWSALFGFSEVALHSLQSLLVLGTTLVAYRLFSTLAPTQGLWLTALLMLSPGVLVEQNLMVDVPLLGLWLGFFAALPVGGGRAARGAVAAGFICGLAILTKYSSLLLLPILVVAILRLRRPSLLLALVIPLGMAAAWSGWNVVDYGHIHMLDRPVGPSGPAGPEILRKALAWVITFGAISPFGLLVIAGSGRVAAARAWLGFAAAGVVVLGLAVMVWLGTVGDTASQAVLVVLFLVNAAVMGGSLMRTAGARLLMRSFWASASAADATTLMLVLWILGDLSFYVLFAPFMAVRHVMLVLPAVLLLLSRRLPERLPRGLAALCLATTAGLSAMLGAADYRMAAFYRDAAPTLARAVPAGARVWFTGHWGWQWYARKAGFIQVDFSDLQLRAGDYLAAPSAIGDFKVPPTIRLEPVRVIGGELGIAGFCTADLARFYLTESFHPPWQITRACTTAVTLYRVA